MVKVELTQVKLLVQSHVAREKRYIHKRCLSLYLSVSNCTQIVLVFLLCPELQQGICLTSIFSFLSHRQISRTIWSSIVATGSRWPLCTRTVASATEKLNFKYLLILINLNLNLKAEIEYNLLLDINLLFWKKATLFHFNC